MTERSVFIAALDIPDGDERSAFLEEACRGDRRLQARLGALLRAHDAANGFMERPAAEFAVVPEAPQPAGIEEPAPPRSPTDNPPATAQSPDVDAVDLCGTRIGRYQLLQRLGDGAFGIVYLAEQVEPVRRKVAVKIIRPGMDTREVIARFEAERQALALMDHPNIARVLDAGATSDTVRPYFVMELVTGVPITEFCDLNQFNTRERLELFAAVCRAVQHAHQKGIIHRDLKPSNILVTLQDHRPVPKVIDFGIAKALKSDLSERTLYTACGQLIGTPAYMSPEQAELGGVDVDTRSDIYALGVLLYELLMGRTPLDAERLRAGNYADLLRMIREEDPPRPSMRLTALGATDVALIARQRGTDPQRLQRELAGDLDWIVMKALEKDRARRFESAAALARDVERFLEGAAVEARPPSQRYLFQRFVRRHKRRFFLAASLVVLLAMGIVGLAIANVRIRSEQLQTASERDRAERALRLADTRARENAELIVKLQSASALVSRARVYMDWLQWDDAEVALNQAIALLPEYAAARRERGNLYARLGLWDLAARDLSIAVAGMEPDTSDDWLSHALLCRCVGDSDGYHRACARMHEFFDGSNHRIFTMDVIRACTIGPDVHGDPAQLVALAEAVVAVEPDVPEFLYVLGLAHFRAGQFESAIGRLQHATTIDPAWTSRPMVSPILAMCYQALGRKEEARRTIDEAAAALDGWTSARYDTLHKLWVVYDGGTTAWPLPWQDWLQCQLQFREAQQVLGLNTPDDPRRHVLRGRAFAGVHQYDNANSELDQALQLSPDDQELRALAHHVRASSHVERGEWAQAAREFARAGELRPEEPYLLHFQAVAHLGAGEMESFQRACADMLERFGETQDPRAAHTVVELCTLTPDAIADPTRLLPVARVASQWYPGASRFYGAALYRCGNFEAAIEQLQAADAHHRATAGDLFFLSMAQYRQGTVDEGRHRLEAAVAWIDQADRQGSDDLRGTRPAWGRWDERVVFPILRREAEGLICGDLEHGRRFDAN